MAKCLNMHVDSFAINDSQISMHFGILFEQ